MKLLVDLNLSPTGQRFSRRLAGRRSTGRRSAAAGELVAAALRQFKQELEKGALIVLDESRARVLPLA
jgi:predicted nuclease of predicted toxin-antitoxin system